MNRKRAVPRMGVLAVAIVATGMAGMIGCAPKPDFEELRMEGQRAMIAHDYAAARKFFQRAEEEVPKDAVNLHDLGDCCLYFARAKFEERNYPAAMREVDRGIGFYDRSIRSQPGFSASLLGKNIALELKGQFEQAVNVAEWAVAFVGPSAKQQIFLAREMEERGDHDAALLRLQQAIAMEPNNPAAHAEIGRFYIRTEKPELAAAHLRKAYALDPTNTAVLDDLAQLGEAVPTASQSPARP